MQPTNADHPDPRDLGARLRDARRGAGLTQQQVAEAMDMARTTIIAIEKGERRVAAEELVALAKLYRRQVAELAGRDRVTEGFVPQFRSTEREVLSEHTDYERSAYELQRLAEDYLQIEEVVGVKQRRPYPPVYETTGATLDHVASEVATAERNRLGLGDGPVGNLRERLETDVGIKIFYLDMPSKIAGLFAYNSDLGACVAINARHPRDRRHWSLAHEYGHFLMHRYRAEITVLETRRSGRPKERLADAFAENFLMPASGLNRRFTELQRGAEKGITLADIVTLSNLYQVAVQAMVLRLETLRRLPPGTWERLVVEGFKVREAQRLLGIDANPPMRNALPRRYVALAIEAYKKGDLSEGQLARFLRTDRLSARLQVEESRQEIHQEQEGEFTQLELDLAQPLSGGR